MGARFGSRIPPFSLPGDGEGRPQSSFGPTYLEEFAPLLSWSAKASTVRRVIEKVAGTDATVLVRGESGVGKDLVARAIHAASSRHGGPFVKVNCAALPAELLESELFGHEKGAFTGAYARKPGKFEFANRGTICLDEIGEVPRLLQSKLLHVLQDLQFTRLGGRETIQADARVVAITNRDLEAAIARGDFREDLYYRLNVVEIWVPPLRSSQRLSPPWSRTSWLDSTKSTTGRSSSRLTRSSCSATTRGRATFASWRTPCGGWSCWAARATSGTSW